MKRDSRVSFYLVGASAMREPRDVEGRVARLQGPWGCDFLATSRQEPRPLLWEAESSVNARTESPPLALRQMATLPCPTMGKFPGSPSSARWCSLLSWDVEVSSHPRTTHVTQWVRLPQHLPESLIVSPGSTRGETSLIKASYRFFLLNVALCCDKI